MRVAIEGCCHAELDAIYGTLAEADRIAGQKTDLLLICGDFQAIRNQADLQCLAVPQKYRQLGEFHRYYNGEKQAPLLTIIIGGNHEASNYMWELYHGGWVAPNIYYLGCSGSVLVNGLRIAGASGIFKAHDYAAGHFERMSYDNSTMRSIYHIREYDVFRLSQLRLAPPTIFLSHDWPLSIEKHGDVAGLLRAKPFFADEIRDNRLGSPPLLNLMRALKPTYWFAAHLHVRFSALYKHNNPGSTLVRGQPVNLDQMASGPMGRGGNPNNTPLGERKPPNVVQQPSLAEKTGDLLHNADEIVLDMDKADQPDAGIDESIDVKAGQELISVAMDEEIDLDISADVDAGDTATDAAQSKLGARTAVSENANGNPDEIDIAMSDEEGETAKSETRPSFSVPETVKSGNETRFLALNKCLPGKDFLQILDFPTSAPAAPDNPVVATFDPLWLAITRAFAPYFSLQKRPETPLPRDENVIHGLIDRELAWVRANVRQKGEAPLEVIQQFVKTAPAPSDHGGRERGPPPWYTNPQTEAFCQFIGIENRINPRTQQLGEVLPVSTE